MAVESISKAKDSISEAICGLAAEKYYSITEPDGEPTSNAVKF
jgi:hypothetical protein